MTRRHESGVLGMRRDPWIPGCGPRGTQAYPVPDWRVGAGAVRLPVELALQRGVALWVTKHSQWDIRDDSSQEKWACPRTLCCGLSCDTLVIVFDIYYCIHIVLIQEVAVYFTVQYYIIACTLRVEMYLELYSFMFVWFTYLQT